MEWVYTSEPIEYLTALEKMQAQVIAIHSQSAPEMIWGLQHLSVFTAGTSAKAEDLIDDLGFPVHQTGRGGQLTYHGPGQLIMYVMINLAKRDLPIKKFVSTLESWVVDSLKELGIQAEKRDDHIGLWVPKANGEQEKIAAIGVRVSKGVTSHGLALNISPNLDYFKGIVPCGLNQSGVTSAEKLGKKISIKEVFNVMKSLSPFR
jgi:lipoyl(octanoyl) transferase